MWRHPFFRTVGWAMAVGVMTYTGFTALTSGTATRWYRHSEEINLEGPKARFYVQSSPWEAFAPSDMEDIASLNETKWIGIKPGLHSCLTLFLGLTTRLL